MNEFLLLAIREFNSQCSDTPIVEETDDYKIKLAKKNGKPDFDLPAISHQLAVKESNWSNFSIPLNDKHFVMDPPETINKNQENDRNLLTSSTFNGGNDNQKLSSTKKENRNIEINENPGGICCCFLACFKKKKE